MYNNSLYYNSVAGNISLEREVKGIAFLHFQVPNPTIQLALLAAITIEAMLQWTFDMLKANQCWLRSVRMQGVSSDDQRLGLAEKEPRIWVVEDFAMAGSLEGSFPFTCHLGTQMIVLLYYEDVYIHRKG